MTRLVNSAKEFTLKTPRLRSFLSRGVDWLLDLTRLPPAGLRGPMLHGRADDVAPVVLLYQPDAEEAAVEKTLDAVPELCRAANVRVVLVLDRPHLSVVRRKGLAVELLPSREMWDRREARPPWPALVHHRLAMFRQDYAAAAAILAPSGGLSAADTRRLAAALRSDPVVRQGAAFRRRVLSRLVCLLDRPARRSQSVRKPFRDARRAPTRVVKSSSSALGGPRR